MAADDLKNVSISVFDYLSTQLSGTASIDFPGVPFESAGLEQWFQPRLLGPTTQPSRRNDRTEFYTLNVNCFARTGRDVDGNQKATVWAHLDLAGEARDAFHQADVPVKDWDAGGDPVIGYLRFEEAEVVPIVDVSSTDLQQAALTVSGALIL